MRKHLTQPKSLTPNPKSLIKDKSPPPEEARIEPLPINGIPDRKFTPIEKQG
jgi:hypothetical protein